MEAPRGAAGRSWRTEPAGGSPRYVRPDARASRRRGAAREPAACGPTRGTSGSSYPRPRRMPAAAGVSRWRSPPRPYSGRSAADSRARLSPRPPGTAPHGALLWNLGDPSRPITQVARKRWYVMRGYAGSNPQRWWVRPDHAAGVSLRQSALKANRRGRRIGGGMQVSDGMSSIILTIGPGHTLRDAAKAMTERKVGAAVVMDPDQPGPGIITERDLLESIGRGQS